MRYLTLFLLFLTTTIAYRVELGPASFALLEPFALLVVTVLWGSYWYDQGFKLSLLKEPLVFLLGAFVLWVTLIRPFSPDWKHGLSDIRDWIIAVLLFVTLVSTIRTNWQKVIDIFLAVVIIQLSISIIQLFTDEFRPFITVGAFYKNTFFVSQEGIIIQSPLLVGLFGHPGVLADFLFVGLMLTLGLYDERLKWLRILLILLLIVMIVLAFSKAVIFTLLPAIMLFFALRSERRELVTKIMLGALGLLVVALLAFLWWGSYGNNQTILSTSFWRLAQWKTVFDLLRSYPIVWFFGNGMDIGKQAEVITNNPHNIYFFILLQYGVMGLLLLASIIIAIIYKGLKAYRTGMMQYQPLLISLWLSIIGLLVFGFVGTSLSYIEYRTFFLIVLAFFVGLYHQSTHEIEEETYHVGNQ